MMGDLLQDRIIKEHEKRENERRWKELAMTCRFEEEFKGRQYPRSCPTCQFGPCKKGYKQKKHDNGGYTLVDANGVDRMGNVHADMQAPSQGLTIPEPKPQPERIGYTNDPPQPVPNSGPMSLHKRLKLMVYLHDTFKITSEAELFERVGEIERLTRD